LVFGLFPALQAANPRLQDALKESGRGTTQDRGGRMRSALVVAEIALALMTLASAGLMLRSFGRLAAIDPGFDVRNVLAMHVSLTGQRDLTGERREVFYQQVLEQIRRLPGVESASAINHLPLAGDIWNFGISIEGRPALPRGQGISAVYRVCRPDYFGTMGLALVRGRDFNQQDAPGAPGVVIINERLASRHWPNDDPLGKRITFDDPNGTARWLTIVGIVENAKQSSWADEADIETYIPFQQSGGFFDQPSGQYASMTVVVRTKANPMALAGSLPGAVRSVNASVPVSSVASLEQIVANAVWQPRFNLIVIGLFAGLALALAAVGIYGVIAYSVKQRTQEIGIRMTLGAQRSDVLRLVVGQGMKLALAGVALGLAGALALAQVLARLLFQVKPTDPLTLLGVVLVLTSVAFLACYLPARRASRIDPMEALRHE
jgi:predicted permease